MGGVRRYKNSRVARIGRVFRPKPSSGKLAKDSRSRTGYARLSTRVGNYEDRKSRDDVRYILTYIAQSLGYEAQAHNPIIEDVIDAYPGQRIIMTLDVAETATGHDRAALIDKFGGGSQELRQSGRAKH